MHVTACVKHARSVITKSSRRRLSDDIRKAKRKMRRTEKIALKKGDVEFRAKPYTSWEIT